MNRVFGEHTTVAERLLVVLVVLGFLLFLLFDRVIWLVAGTCLIYSALALTLLRERRARNFVRLEHRMRRR